MTLFDYTVTYDPTGTPLDITDFVERIEIIDIGTGETRSAIIRLNAQDGQFITRANQQGTNADTPLVEAFDKIEISILDRENSVYDEVFEVNILKPIQNSQQGVVLEVQMLGLEYYLLKNNFTKQFRYENGFTVARDILDFYNGSLPTTNNLNPIVSGQDNNSQNGGSNDLPVSTANHYMFGISELSHYEALTQTVNKMAAPVAAGGAGNFFESYFRTDDVSNQDLIFLGFESGNPPAQQVDPANDNFAFDASKAVIINDTVSVNPGEEEGGIEAFVANQTAVWGQDGIGTLPTQNNQFSGELEAWLRIPEHITGAFYPEGSLVQDSDQGEDTDGDIKHYRANQNTSQPVTDASWTQEFFTQFVTVPNYSKWSNSQVREWRNSGANNTGLQGVDAGFLENSTFEQIATWDGNLVVEDETFKRSYADIRAVDLSTINPNFFRNSHLYRGFRILVDTAIGTPVSPLDAFPDELVQVRNHDANGDEIWGIVKELPNKSLCAIDLERNTGTEDGGKVYQFTNVVVGSLPQWAALTFYNVGDQVQDVSIGYECVRATADINPPASNPRWEVIVQGWNTTAGNLRQGNDCYHPVWQMTNSQGFNDRNNGMGGNYGTNSAITYEYRYNQTLLGTGDSINYTSPNFQRIGAWANFKFPFPYTSDNLASIGVQYGNNDKLEPATLDQYNMHLTPSGFVGFNNVEAENLGPLDTITFWTNFEWRGLGIAGEEIEALVLQGNIKCRCFMYDTNDTVVSQDFVISFNNLWEPISLPFSDFKIYRARTPWAFGDAAQNIFLQGLEILDVFRYENIKRICFQWMGPYDDQGRYQPWGQTGVTAGNIADVIRVQPGAYQIRWSFDYFSFGKPMLSVSPPIDTGRLLQTNFFQEPLIDNKVALDQTATANLDLTQFPHREYETVTEGLINVPYGYSFFLKNEDIVREAELPVSALPQWVTATDYVIGNLVQNNTDGYECKVNHTSDGTNEPPNGAFWQLLTDPVSNTIKLVNKRTKYVIDKPPTGPGGFLRTILGVKIIES